MKRLLCIFLLTAVNLFASQPTAPTPKTMSMPILPGTTVNFTLYVNTTQDAKSNNSTNISTAQINTDTQPSLLKKLAQLKNELPALKDAIHSGTHFFSTYKWYVLGATLVGSYGLIGYIIASGNSYLGNPERWSSWHQELPLDQLLAIPQQQFSQELVHEIQRRYTEPSSLTDLAKPLTMFLKAIEQEEEQIKWYQSWYSWLSYAYITKLIPFWKQRYSQIPQRLQRIAYYKNIFQSWAAQYQMEHANRCAATLLNEANEEITF